MQEGTNKFINYATREVETPVCFPNLVFIYNGFFFFFFIEVLVKI